MTYPTNGSGGGVASRRRQAPVAFRTASGQVTRPAAGQSVALNDVRRMVDVVFVCDTTGSMYNKLTSLLACIIAFVKQLAGLKLDWRFSLLPFGDLTVPGDKVEAQLPFVDTVDAATRMIRHAPRFSGGSNEGESSMEAMLAAIEKPYRTGAVKVIVLLTDEPPLQRGVSARQINSRLRDGEVICFVASPRGYGYESLARDNGGKWYAIGPTLDTSELLRFMTQLLDNVSKVSAAVHSLGGGSVRRYLANPDRKALT